MPLFHRRTVSFFTASATLAFLGALGWNGAQATGKPQARKSAQTAAKTVDYNRDIRPLLSDKCLACHGADPKAVQAGLRLDTWAGATAKLSSESRAIVPGSPQKSELIARIQSKDAAEQMPPPASHKTLTVAEKNLLARWISEGAEYKPHWAFVKPVRPPLPVVRAKNWPINGIDYFVLARLEKEGLAPSPFASRQTLIRRVSLDLTGLPPTPAETVAFVADKSPNAYEKVVDRLLASPRYGEKMAQAWMDGARYADSNGYQADYERFQYRWRDWVIDAYNKNMPFDEFTVEQIAGDLLHNATVEQKVATGFNRNHRINTEGGVIPEEWRVETVIDRAEATSEVWMGLTMGCARCHDHKYDPVSQKDFYRFTSYFNNVPETGSGPERPVNHPPFIKAPTAEQTATLAALTTEASKAHEAREQRETGYGYDKAEAFCRASVPQEQARLATGLETRLTFGQTPAGAQVIGKPAFDALGNVSGAVRLDGVSFLDYGQGGAFENGKGGFSYGCWINPQEATGVPLSRMDDANAYRGWDIFMANGQISAHIVSHWPDDAVKVTTNETVPTGKWTHVFVTSDGSGKASGVKVYINGQPATLRTDSDTWHGGTLVADKPLRVGGRSTSMGFKGSVDEARLYKRELPPIEVGRLYATDQLRPILTAEETKRTPEQKQAIIRYALSENAPDYQQLIKREGETAQARDAFDAGIPTSMVMEEMPTPRPAFVLVRGEYDKHGESVSAGLPPSLGGLPAGAPNNRLGLARWIASADNSLTARVAVNRMWEKFWGTGIVATPDDFGVRADFPSHPELLDWLATEFVRLKWDMKALQKEIVLSAAYRQSSAIPPLLARRDKDNRLLARGPRFRLPAETIRDQSLFVSGLLFEKVGGPSVRPYQPAGFWDETSVYGNLRNYKHDTKPDGLYRRSLYTFWKRTAAPPTMSLFDVPGRDTCRIRRSRTNTPLQALALMNETTFVEAARVLAQNMVAKGGQTPQSRINYGFQTVLGRTATPNEQKILQAGLQKRLMHYQAAPESAAALLSVGDAPRPQTANNAELAAYTMTASVLLNLDEAITKE